MLAELTEWFSLEAAPCPGTITCREITGEDGPGPSAERCARIVSGTWEKVLSILTGNGIELS
jgi:hypothetical protein